MRLTYAPIAAILVACISLFSGHAQAAPQPYAICSNQTYALCAAASAFVYQEVSYAKCVIKNGNSISAPPLTYTENGTQKNICDLNAEGKTNGYMSSTFSLPTEVRRGGNKALYTCAGGSTGDYAQCDGGTCFTSTRGKVFPGVGQLGPDEIICSCPITKANTSIAPAGYQFIGPFPCQPAAFNACSQRAKNGDIIPVGAPTGAGRILTEALYGRNYAINECRQ
jgi:hypothetical protein